MSKIKNTIILKIPTKRFSMFKVNIKTNICTKKDKKFNIAIIIAITNKNFGIILFTFP